MSDFEEEIEFQSESQYSQERIEYEIEVDESLPSEQSVQYEVEELLASFVQLRPALWDSRLPLVMRSKTLRDELWLEIFREFGEQFSIEFLQKKWRNLRDTFIKVKGDIESYVPSGSAANKKRKKVWKYYETLSFLKDTIAARKTTYSGGAFLNTTPKKILPGPSSQSQAESEPVSESGRKKATAKRNVDEAILSMIETIPQNKPFPQPPINPICMRISELLTKMPQNERTLLEIKLLSEAYEGSKKYL